MCRITEDLGLLRGGEQGSETQSGLVPDHGAWIRARVCRLGRDEVYRHAARSRPRCPEDINGATVCLVRDTKAKYSTVTASQSQARDRRSLPDGPDASLSPAPSTQGRINKHHNSHLTHL